MLKRPLLLALILGLMTSFAVWMIEDYVPNSELKAAFINVMVVPGAVIAGVAYPQGIHSSGAGVEWWGLWVMVANLAIYVAFWYGCIRLLGYVSRKFAPSHKA